jgi:hypothetical protein
MRQGGSGWGQASGRGLWSPWRTLGKPGPSKPNVIFIGAPPNPRKVFKISLVYFTRRPVSLCSTSNNHATLETSQGQLCGVRNISDWTPFTAELKFPNLHANRTYRRQHRIDEIDPFRTFTMGGFPKRPHHRRRQRLQSGLARLPVRTCLWWLTSSLRSTRASERHLVRAHICFASLDEAQKRRFRPLHHFLIPKNGDVAFPSGALGFVEDIVINEASIALRSCEIEKKCDPFNASTNASRPADEDKVGKTLAELGRWGWWRRLISN